MKNNILKYVSLVCAAALVLVACSNQRTVSVSGTGTVTFLPDTVNFSITVRNLKPAMTASVSTTAATIKEVLAVCKQFGINDEDLKTSYVNTGKKYERKDYNSPEIFAGYTAEQTIQISYRDLVQFQKFSEALLSLDISALNNVYFTHSKISQFTAEADLKALDSAKETAAKMAGRMDVKLGSLVYMTNSGESVSPYRNSYANAPVFSSRAVSESAGVEISPGILSVTGNVQAIFEIK